MAKQNKDRTIRVLIGVIALMYFLGLAGFYLYHLLSFPSEKVLSHLYFAWVWNRSVSSWISFLFPLHCAALLVAFGLFYRLLRGSIFVEGEGKRDYQVTSFIVVLVFALFHILITELGGPFFHRQVAIIEAKSQTAYGLEEAAERALKRGDYSQVREYGRLYTLLDPSGNLSLERTLNQAIKDTNKKQKEMEKEQEENMEEDPGEKSILFLREQSSSDFAEKAQRFFKEGDYVSARYYASLALELDTNNSQAQKTLEYAQRALGETGLTKEEQEEALLFRKKEEGAEYLKPEESPSNPVAAYYLFKDLKTQYPKDPDIEEFYGKAERAVRRTAYFLDEVKDLPSIPGITGVAFLLSEEDGKRIFHYKKVAFFRENYYAEDCEIVRLTNSGDLMYRVQAPYGKFIGTELVLNGIHREDPSKVAEPRVISRNEEDSQKYITPIEVPLTAEKMFYFSDRIEDLAGLSVGHLLEALDLWGQFGYDTQAVKIELVFRLFRAFSFLTLALFVLWMGIRFRTLVSGAIPGLGVLAIVFIPWIAHRGFDLFLYSGKLLLGGVVFLSGAGMGLLAVLLIHLFLVFLNIFLFLRVR